MTREVIWRWVTPRWKKHLEALIERERPDAVIVFTVPMAHLRGIPSALRAQVRHPGRLLRRRRADEPARVRRHGHRLQLVPRRRPVGVRPAGLELGGRPRAAARARRAPRRGGLLGRRPGVLRAAGGREGVRRLLLRLRRQVPARLDAGDGRRAVARASRRRTSRSAAATSRATPATRGSIGDIPFNVFARAISAARVNLCITRRSHATVYASSSCRPFELASAGAAIVSNPYNGLERWFEPGSELLVVEDAAQAIAAYRELLADPGQAEEMGRRARERVLDEHTYRHRARQLLVARRHAGARVKKIAIVPAYNEQGAIGGVIDEMRAFDPEFDVLVVDDARMTRPPRRARAARRTRRHAAVQPRHRRRGADRLPLRRAARLRARGPRRRRRPARPGRAARR